MACAARFAIVGSVPLNQQGQAVRLVVSALAPVAILDKLPDVLLLEAQGLYER